METETQSKLSLDAIFEFYDLKGNIEGIRQWHVKYTPDIVQSKQVFNNIMQSYEQEYQQLERNIQLKENIQKKIKQQLGEDAIERIKALPDLDSIDGCDSYFVKIKSVSQNDMLLSQLGKCFCGGKNAGVLNPLK